MKNSVLLRAIAAHRASVTTDPTGPIDSIERLGRPRAAQTAQVAPPGDPLPPPPGDAGAPPAPGGAPPAPGGPVDGTVPLDVGDPSLAPPGEAGHDPAVADEVRGLRDQLDEVQRAQQDLADGVRDMSREFRDLRLDDASPAERDEEVARMRENLVDERSGVSAGEFGVRDVGLAAGRQGGAPQMTTYRQARLARQAKRRQAGPARGRTAQSNEHGEIFPSGTGVDLENDHWSADTQADANQSTPPPPPKYQTESDLSGIEGDDRPEWMEETARAVRAFEVDICRPSNAEPFFVVSESGSERPLARINRPAAVKAERFATQEYAANLKAFIGQHGFAATMRKVGGVQVTPDLAARLRAARASAGGQPAAAPAAGAAGSPTNDLFSDPRVAKQVDQVLRATRDGRRRAFGLAWRAMAAGHIDNPLAGALATTLGSVTPMDPMPYIEDAFLMAGEQMLQVLEHQASLYERESPDALAATERLLTGRMAPRRHSTAAGQSEGMAMRTRAEHGSRVPMTAGRSTVDMGMGEDMSFEVNAGVGGYAQRIAEAMPGNESFMRLQRLRAGGYAPPPRGVFRGQ